jgi:hypothetical protein
MKANTGVFTATRWALATLAASASGGAAPCLLSARKGVY